MNKRLYTQILTGFNGFYCTRVGHKCEPIYCCFEIRFALDELYRYCFTTFLRGVAVCHADRTTVRNDLCANKRRANFGTAIKCMRSLFVRFATCRQQHSLSFASRKYDDNAYFPSFVMTNARKGL